MMRGVSQATHLKIMLVIVMKMMVLMIMMMKQT